MSQVHMLCDVTGISGPCPGKLSLGLTAGSSSLPSYPLTAPLSNPPFAFLPTWLLVLVPTQSTLGSPVRHVIPHFRRTLYRTSLSRPSLHLEMTLSLPFQKCQFSLPSSTHLLHMAHGSSSGLHPSPSPLISSLTWYHVSPLDVISLLDISVNSSCFLASSTWMLHCPQSSSLKQNSAPLLPRLPKLLPPKPHGWPHQPHFAPSHILPEHLPPPLISNKSCGPILSLIALGPSSPHPISSPLSIAAALS